MGVKNDFKTALQKRFAGHSEAPLILKHRHFDHPFWLSLCQRIGQHLHKEIGNGVGMVARKEVEQDAREKAEGTG